MSEGKSLPGRARIVCFGGAAVDRTYVAHRPIRAATSNPATGSLGFGGVARNVAVNLTRLGIQASLVSIVGEDADGRSLIAQLRDLGIETDGVRLAPDCRTAEYVAILRPERTLAVGLADMAIFDRLEFSDLSRLLSGSASPDWIFADGNLSSEVLAELLGGGGRGTAKLAVDAVSTPKAERLPRDLGGLDLLFLNMDEAAALLDEPRDALSPDAALRALHSRGVGEVVLTLGADGLALADETGDARRVPAVAARTIDVTGAGDALIAAVLAWRLDGATALEAARMGTLAAALTLEQPGSTHSGLSRELLTGSLGRLS